LTKPEQRYCVTRKELLSFTCMENNLSYEQIMESAMIPVDFGVLQMSTDIPLSIKIFALFLWVCASISLVLRSSRFFEEIYTWHRCK
jgi:hypothetical protein